MQEFHTEKAELIMTLRGMGVLDPAVLSAIEAVPRELFVPAALRQHAYENASLPIALDQTISQPYVVARMTEALQLTGRERVLEIGCGSGYQAAILTFLCRRVYSMERLKPLLVDAENKLRDLRISNISLRHGDGANGWSAKGPFDGIILTAAPRRVPENLFSQLPDQGVLVAPEGSNRQQRLLYWMKQDGIAIRHQSIDVIFVPLKSGQA